MLRMPVSDPRNHRKGLRPRAIARYLLATASMLPVLVAGSACISGQASRPQHVSTNLVDRAFVLPETRSAIERVYEERATCDGYLSAAENGVSRANSWRIGLAIVQGILGAGAAVTGSLSGANAASAATDSGKASEAARSTPPDPQKAASIAADAENSARAAKVYGGVAAGSAGVAALVLAFDNILGPTKAREQYLATRDRIDQIKREADKSLDAYAAEMRKSDRNISNAVAHINAARAMLQSCTSASGTLSWNRGSISNYESKAQDVYGPLLRTVEYVNSVAARVEENESRMATAAKAIQTNKDKVAKYESVLKDPSATAAQKQQAKDDLTAAQGRQAAAELDISSARENIGHLKDVKRALDEGDNAAAEIVVKKHPELKLDVPPSTRPTAPGKGT